MVDSAHLISWFDSREAFLAHERSLPRDCDIERELSRHDQVAGSCPACGRATAFQVCNGAKFADRPNLREGLVCRHCRLSARQRTLLCALVESGIPADGRSGAILERFSRLYAYLKRLEPDVSGSEYLGADATSGRLRLWWRPGKLPIPQVVRHQSIGAMSFGSASLRFLLHTDVLEHVADTGAALAECRRVLAPGRPMIFTVPFFSALDETIVRGYRDASDQLIELLPGEYHGDGMKAGGIYTYYNFGWTLFEALQRAFASAEIGVAYSPRHGLVQADSEESAWNMRPIVFRCYA